MDASVLVDPSAKQLCVQNKPFDHMYTFIYALESTCRWGSDGRCIL